MHTLEILHTKTQSSRELLTLILNKLDISTTRIIFKICLYHRFNKKSTGIMTNTLLRKTTVSDFHLLLKLIAQKDDNSVGYLLKIIW